MTSADLQFRECCKRSRPRSPAVFPTSPSVPCPVRDREVSLEEKISALGVFSDF